MHVIRMGEHIAQLKDTDHSRSYDTKKYTCALYSVEAVWQVGPGAVSSSVSVVATEDDFLVLC